jgi:hypothetical protein
MLINELGVSEVNQAAPLLRTRTTAAIISASNRTKIQSDEVMKVTQ